MYKENQIIKYTMNFWRLLPLFLSVILLFITCGDDEPAPQNDIQKAPTLTFTKLIVDKQEVTKEQLLGQIKEKEKEGYTIKNITISEPSFADIDRDKMSLKLKKAGTFTIRIILEKDGFESVTIEAIIVYLVTEALTFDKLTTAKSTLSKEDILKQVKGNKDGFIIKSITIGDSYQSFAEVKGTAPNFSLTFKKTGDFTATIVLEKANHKDVTLNASFSGAPEKLTFNRFTTHKKVLNKDDILNQIPEPAKAGYALKSIAISAAYQSFVTVGGAAPDITLTLKKLGVFKADITLSRAGYFDVTIQEAVFSHIEENLKFATDFKTYKKTLTKNDILAKVQGNKTGYSIVKILVKDTTYADANPTTYSLTLKKDGIFGITLTLQKTGYPQLSIDGQIEYRPKPTLTFDKLITAKRTITKAEIERQIKGSTNGYSLTSVVVTAKDFATVGADLSMSLKKVGSFTATIVLQRHKYFDVTLQASFEGKAEPLTFDRLSTWKNTISGADILKQVKGGSNYTIKSISVSDKTFATANSDFSLSIKKEGSFTATITLQKAGYFDVVISNAAFRFQQDVIFTTFKTDKRILTTSDLFKEIQGNKAGYSIVKVAVADNSYADVNPSNYSLTLKKDGVFNVTLTLQKAGGVQKVLNGTIEHRSKPTLTFRKLVSAKINVSKVDIENQISGDKKGYAIASIAIDNDDFARVTSTLSLELKKPGNFTATLTLKKAGYFDVTLRASFEGKAVDFTFDPLLIDYRAALTNADIFARIKGYQKTSYSIKTISNITDNAVAQVQGTGAASSLLLKKAGIFTATIVLERNGYFDATINAASFTIQKAAQKKLSFRKLTIPYTEKITKAALQARVDGERGYVISRIANISRADVAEVTGIYGHALGIKKAGSFTANITLVHDKYNDVTIAAEFDLTKLPKKDLKFAKWTSYRRSFAQKDILKQITGAKERYTLVKFSNIREISGSPGVVLKGGSLRAKKPGIFTVTLILQSPIYADVIITGAEFEIKSPDNKIKLAYVNPITSTAIESKLQQLIGYTIKSISGIDPVEMASLATGSKTSLAPKKAGVFVATLTLQKAGQPDVVRVTEFEITKLPAKTLSIPKNTLTFTYKRIITSDDILQEVTGAKAGYTFKSIKGSQSLFSDYVELTGVGVGNISLYVKKAKPYPSAPLLNTILIFEHPIYADVTLNNIGFDIRKLPAKVLQFPKWNVPFGSKITLNDVVKRITGPKDGYSIHQVRLVFGVHNEALAALSGVEIKYQKAGKFSMNLAMIHPIYSTSYMLCQIQITKKPSKKLRFDPLTHSGDDFISKETILKQVRGTKAGYTLKAISGISDSDVAELSGTGLKIKKAGRFTATIVLEHSEYSDAVLTGAQFTITKKQFNKKLVFKKLVTYEAFLTSRHLLPQLRALSGAELSGTELSVSGFSIKRLSNIQALSGASDIAALSGDVSIKIKRQAGIFTTDFVLSHPFYLDIALTGARFEKEKAFIFNEREKAIIGVTPQYRAYFMSATSLILPDQINGIDVEVIRSVASGIGDIGKNKSNNLLGSALSGSPAIKTIRFPRKLKRITQYAFNNFGRLTSVHTIPNSVEEIGLYAFSNCGLLASITLPNSLQTLGAFVFSSCIKLSSITLPNSLKTIGERAFGGGYSLSHITIPDSVTTIGKNAFVKCNALATVKLSNKITALPHGVFQGCSNLTTVTLSTPNSLKTIGSSAFHSCSSLTSLPAFLSLEEVGIGAFKNCSSLTTIRLSNKIKVFKEYVFEGCSNLTSLLPDFPSLERVLINAFKGCSKLTAITLPTSIRAIRRDAFASCSKLVVTLDRGFATPHKIEPIKSSGQTEGVTTNVTTFDVEKIRVPARHLHLYKHVYPWSIWRDKMEPISSLAQKLAFKKLTTYKTILTKEDILPQITELSGGALPKGYVTLKSISNVRALTGTVYRIAEVSGSGTSMEIKKAEITFKADLVLSRPGYLDMTLTGAVFEKEKAFVFNRGYYNGADKSLQGTFSQDAGYFCDVPLPNRRCWCRTYIRKWH